MGGVADTVGTYGLLTSYKEDGAGGAGSPALFLGSYRRPRYGIYQQHYNLGPTEHSLLFSCILAEDILLNTLDA